MLLLSGCRQGKCIWCRFRHSGSSLSLSKVQAVLFRRTENDSIALKGSQESPGSVFFIYFICLNMWHQLYVLLRKNTIATLGMFIIVYIEVEFILKLKKMFFAILVWAVPLGWTYNSEHQKFNVRMNFFSFNKFYLQDMFCIIKVRKSHKNYFLIMIWVLIGA